MNRLIHLYWGIFIIILFLAAACKSTKGLNKSKENISEKTVLAQWSLLHTSSLPDFPWGGKGKLDIDVPTLTMQVNLQWHTISGQYLWLSISKLGFETHRVLVRPDSIFIIDRLAKQYLMGEVDLWLEKQHIPFAYRDLDRLWYGLPLDRVLNRIETVQKTTGWTITGKDEHDIIYAYQVQQRTLPQMEASNHEYQLSVQQTDFHPFVSDLQLPYKRQIKLVSDQDYQLNLDIMEVKKEYPREINWKKPDGYTPVIL